MTGKCIVCASAIPKKRKAYVDNMHIHAQTTTKEDISHVVLYSDRNECSIFILTVICLRKNKMRKKARQVMYDLLWIMSLNFM